MTNETWAPLCHQFWPERHWRQSECHPGRNNRLAARELRPAWSLPVLKHPTPASIWALSTRSAAHSPVIAVQEETP
jgi:hypothetical protein